MDTIGKRLGAALKQWGSKSQFLRELKERGVTGATFPSLNAYLRDEVPPRLEFLMAAAEILGVRRAWLQTGEGEIMALPMIGDEEPLPAIQDRKKWQDLAKAVALEWYRKRLSEVFPEMEEAAPFTHNQSEVVFSEAVAQSVALERDFPAGGPQDVRKYARDLEAGKLPPFVVEGLETRAEELFRLLLGPASWLYEAMRDFGHRLPPHDAVVLYIHAVVSGWRALLEMTLMVGWLEERDGIERKLSRGARKNPNGAKSRGKAEEAPRPTYAIVTQEGLGAVAVVTIPIDNGPPFIVAYLVQSGGQLPPPDQIRDELAADLPDHMKPDAMMVVPELPRDATGELDIEALPLPPPLVKTGSFLKPRRVATDHGKD